MYVLAVQSAVRAQLRQNFSILSDTIFFLCFLSIIIHIAALKAARTERFAAVVVQKKAKSAQKSAFDGKSAPFTQIRETLQKVNDLSYRRTQSAL